MPQLCTQTTLVIDAASSFDRRKRRIASDGQRDARVTTRAGEGHGSSGNGNGATVSRDGHLQDEHAQPSQTTETAAEGP